MTSERTTAELEAELARQHAVIGELEAKRVRLQQLLLDMPKLLAPREPDALIAACAEAARAVSDAAFALFVPAADEPVQTLVGLEWADFSEAPAPGLAPVLGVDRRAQSRRVDDVTRLPTNDAAALLYGVLNDGRLVRSWLLTPVRGHEHALRGVLYVGHPRPDAFDSSHEQCVAILGASLGIALDAAQLTAERERVLTALESSLLPPLLPDIPEIDVAARYRAADDVARIGGDFYDVFRSGEARWSAILGDVCGTGPEAAAITGIARYSVRALSAEHEPAAALERLNLTLGQYTNTRFLTAVLADLVVQPSGRVAVTLANAGHPSPLVLRDDGTTTAFERPHGALLGMFPTVGATDIAVELGAGDALILYTDGVVEARDKQGELFGIDRLVDLVSTSSGRSAEGIARRIELAAVGHAAGTVDDIAILVVRRRPPTRGA
jgi:serine phosphatase RsbU (regulator of sigma subunit)